MWSVNLKLRSFNKDVNITMTFDWSQTTLEPVSTKDAGGNTPACLDLKSN